MEKNVEQSQNPLTTLDLHSLVVVAEQHLRQAGFRDGTIVKHQRTWNAFVSFARKREQESLTNALIEDWLVYRGYPIGSWPSPIPPTLMNMLTGLRILIYLHEYGDLMPSRVLNPMFRFAHLTRHLAVRPAYAIGQSAGELRVAALAPSFQKTVISYERECQVRGYRTSSLKNMQLHIPRFFKFLMARGMNDVTQITGSEISAFITSLQGYAPGSVNICSCIVRCFLRFLHQQGVLSKDLSLLVPPGSKAIYCNIPTVWSPSDVTRLLAQVDRASPRGKRDYAILLLAAQLGMRVGDIIRLTLDDIRWEHQRIELIQSKNRQPLVLPLLEEVGWALIDYLKHARPVSEYRQVFLSLIYPYAPFVTYDNLHYIITRYRRKAGIPCFKRQPVGMHTLRHSLATYLLAGDVPLSTISEVLGHTCQQSTRVYAKVDLGHLQQCPLDPEEVCHVST